MKALGWVALAALAVAPRGAAAQLAGRVAEIEDGRVRFTYDARDEVEVCRGGVHVGQHRRTWSYDGRSDGLGPCRRGIVEVELRVRDGTVRDVEVVRDFEEESGATDFGVVEADEAARYLVSLAWAGATASAAEDAIFPAAIADVPDVWRDLLDVARDRGLTEDVREAALFWVGQEAAAAVTSELSDVALDRYEDQDVRDAAVFALSQRPPDESIPALISVARTSEGAETRKRAMFWLAQSEDDRVVAFFEEILLGSVR